MFTVVAEMLLLHTVWRIAMTDVCLKGIRVEGNSYWCYLPKGHQGSHHVNTTSFQIYWNEV